jgi:hypothetical protein
MVGVNARAIIGGVALGCALLTGCSSAVGGHPVGAPDPGTEPAFPTPRPSHTATAAPSSKAVIPPSTAAVPPPAPARVLQPENGYVFIATKSGKTRCQLSTANVGCESAFTNSPVVDGAPANGVEFTADGQMTWLLGNLGDIPATTLDYASYSAVGWTIDATSDGTRFTNDRTGRAVFVAVDKVQVF